MIRQYELVDLVSAYDERADGAMLDRAYVFSMKAHGRQKRHSGDPYFSHPVEVAAILAEMKLDSATIATGLLHDTIEDTLATTEQIGELFGDEVKRLVDGVTKLSLIELTSESSQQAENFRKFLMAMSEDIRVLLVKLADRLHNMRTLHFVPKAEKRLRIASETMEIYAPLAERIGMQSLKDELEDLAFREINPKGRESIVVQLDFQNQQNGELTGRISSQISDALKEADIPAQVTGRQKSPYSIWRKLQEKNISFEQLSDRVAFRISVEDVASCYAALGVVHSAWRVVPGRFKDYISTPKRNQYQSLHTTVFGPERQRIEIQIRTKEMDAVAEQGLAAHWSYKQGVGNEGSQYGWLRELLEILDNASGPDEFLEHTKLEMFRDQVFCFTPKGELVVLPVGATVIDFAYAVHSRVGDTCIGAKINGVPVAQRTVLSNGDQVEIQRSSGQVPSELWLTYATTGRARGAIRRHLRLENRGQNIAHGRKMLQSEAEARGAVPGDGELSGILEKFSLDSVDEFYARLGEGTIGLGEVMALIYPDIDLSDFTSEVAAADHSRSLEVRSRGQLLPLRGLSENSIAEKGECCHPLPGDRIVGISLEDDHVMVHSRDCRLLAIFGNAPERWLDLSWDADAGNGKFHIGRINTSLANVPGSLSGLASVLAQQQANICNLKIVGQSPSFFEMMVDVEVRDLRHLTEIIGALRASPAVSSVGRVQG